MLKALITSKTRLKARYGVSQNSRTSCCQHSGEPEFDEFDNAIWLEVNRFEEAEMMTGVKNRNKKVCRTNTQPSLFPETYNLRLKYAGIEDAVKKLWKPIAVCLVRAPAKGKDSSIIALLFAGEVINKNYLLDLMVKVEAFLIRKLHYIIIISIELQYLMNIKNKKELLLLCEK